MSANVIKTWRQMPASERREAISGYLFISPWLIGFLLFTVGPMLFSLYISFTRWNIVGDPKWVGLANYERIFTADKDFRQALLVTFSYAAIYLPLATIVGLAMAMALHLKLKGVGVFRTMLYLPYVVPSIAATLVWVWVLNGRFGLVNTVLAWVGIDGPNWFGDPRTALYGIVMIDRLG